MRLCMRSQLFPPRYVFIDASLLQRHIVNAENRRQCYVVCSAELNANGLTGKAVKVERPSQHIYARRTFILITECCQRSQQCPAGTSHLNKQPIKDGRSGRFVRCDVQPETQVGTTSRNGNGLEERTARAVYTVENHVRNAAVWERTGTAYDLTTKCPWCSS